MSRLRITWIETSTKCVLQPPISKSDAIRVLSLRFARGENLDQFPHPVPDDVEVTSRGLDSLRTSAGNVALDAGSGAAPFRFLLALAATTPGLRCTLNASEQLRRRPHKPLLNSLTATLQSRGLRISHSKRPLEIDTTDLTLPDKSSFTIEPISSQYLSALALAGAAAIGSKRCREVNINIKGKVASLGYAALTAKWICEAGFHISAGKRSWRISGFKRKAWNPVIPSDWSSTACLLIWAWKSGGSMRLPALSGHPDERILDILSSAGLKLVPLEEGIVGITGELKCGLEADAIENPDLIPALGIIALVAPEFSVFRNVGILRDKESDRLQFLLDIAGAAGSACELRGEDLVIHPCSDRGNPVIIQTMADHRRAMAGSLLLALGWQDLIIDDPDCVSKSFPDYWEQIGRCGVRLEEL